MEVNSDERVEVVEPRSPPPDTRGTPDTRDTSDEEEIRVTDSPPPTSPPNILFQPFLPAAAAVAAAAAFPIRIPRPILPFSIDNILKPTFGGSSPPSLRPSSADTAKSDSPPTSKPVDLSTTPKDSNKKDPDQEGVPPGMVRGPNGQLWPAWVFCTRYSDRPSSGKLTIFLSDFYAYYYLGQKNTYI